MVGKIAGGSMAPGRASLARNPVVDIVRLQDQRLLFGNLTTGLTLGCAGNLSLSKEKDLSP